MNGEVRDLELAGAVVVRAGQRSHLPAGKAFATTLGLLRRASSRSVQGSIRFDGSANLKGVDRGRQSPTPFLLLRGRMRYGRW